MSPSKQSRYRNIRSGGFNHDCSSNIFHMLFCLSATVLFCVRVIKAQGFVYEHKIVTCCNSSLYRHGSTSLIVGLFYLIFNISWSFYLVFCSLPSCHILFFFLFPCTDRNLLTAHHLKSKGKFQNLALWMITSTLKIHHQATFARIFSNLWHLRVVSICAALEIGGGLNVQFASSKRGLVMKFA